MKKGDRFQITVPDGASSYDIGDEVQLERGDRSGFTRVVAVDGRQLTLLVTKVLR